MLKEIFEQPESVENTMRGHLLEETGNVRVYGLKLSDTDAKKVKRIIITACGTSWHSALIGKSMMEELARIPTDVEYASEFRYRNPIVDSETLVIAISQSGETADTLAALLEAKQRGARVLGLVNVVGSTISREVDGGMYLRCGPEIGVASTKAFTSQVVALAMVTLRFAPPAHHVAARGAALHRGAAEAAGADPAGPRPRRPRSRSWRHASTARPTPSISAAA